MAAVGVFSLIICSIVQIELVEIIAMILLAPSILMIFAVNIYALKRPKPATFTFDKLVREELNDLFEKINDYYATRTD